MAKTEKSTAVAETKGTAVGSLIGVDELVELSTGDHGFQREDLALPFISILQKLNPQLDKREPEYIAEAEEGDFYNSGTGKVFAQGDTGFYFVAGAYTLNYTEWTPRESGGGLVKDWGADSSILEKTTKNAKNQDATDKGTLIVTSALYFGYVLDVENELWEQAILGMKSTQLKKSRKMNATIQNARITVQVGDQKRAVCPPMYYHVWKITSVPEDNAEGSWMGYKIELSGSVEQFPFGKQLFEDGKSLHDMFKKGELKAATDQLAADEKKTSGAGAGADLEDDIPF